MTGIAEIANDSKILALCSDNPNLSDIAFYLIFPITETTDKRQR